MGRGCNWALDGGEHPHEAHYLKLDCSKAKALLDWHPRWHLEETLESIVMWHRDLQLGKNMKAATLEQINIYSKRVQS